MRMTASDLHELSTRLAPVFERHPYVLNSLRGMWDAFFSIPDASFRQFYVNTYADSHMESAFRKIMSR